MIDATKTHLAFGIIMGALLMAWVMQVVRDNRPAICARVCLAIAIISLVALFLILSMHFARARDDGRYAQSPLKSWFDTLKSERGLCCSFADGETVADPDWESKNGQYRVKINEKWVDVPPDAVITEPNRAGRTMVWPIIDDSGGVYIRCFMPGSMA
jgi:hypothetical protein